MRSQLRIVCVDAVLCKLCEVCFALLIIASVRCCLVGASDKAEDDHHFVFDCPAYCSIRDRFYYHFLGTSTYLLWMGSGCTV